MLHGIDAFLDTRARRKLARTAARQRLELDFERRERLPHVVVQVAREAAALLFLHLEQAPRQRAQALVRELELAIQALERLLRAQALGDVVDLHQARRTAAPRDQVSHALDVDHLAGLLCVPEHAMQHLTAFAAQEIAKRNLLATADLGSRHGEKFTAGIFVEAQASVVHGKETQCLCIDHPHRQRAALEEHAITPLVRVDLVDQPLQERGHRAKRHHRARMVIAGM